MLRIRKRVLVLLLALGWVIFISVYFNQTSENVQYISDIQNGIVTSIGQLRDMLNARVGNAFVVTSSELKPAEKYDLLINSYMNSGSSFTGQLFGFRTGAFYVYEPLWMFGMLDYYRPENFVCSSCEGSIGCAEQSAELVNKKNDSGKLFYVAKNVAKNSTVVGMMIDVLNDIYNCNFSRLENLFRSGVQDDLHFAGPDWNEYRECLNRTETKRSCLQRREQQCKSATHRVTKVLRLTTGSYDKLLEKRPNLKIIQLFRNPFAIINSRTETDDYTNICNNFTANAAVLCHKMEVDYEDSLRLSSKFPGRVKMIFYEDLKSNVSERMEKLYKYIGMEPDVQEVGMLNVVKTNKANSSSTTMEKTRMLDNAHWWRNHLAFSKYQTVKGKCVQMIKYFNLTDFKNRTELKDFSIPEMILPPYLRI